MAIVFGGSACQILAKEVADELGSELGQLTIKNFPDGERYLRIDSDVKGKDCVAIQSTS
ncbi:MAG: ribose-phosphate pyrophosphokinase-like domain-containing protein, partial [Euryarchaeota archaeon]|nr:ribose-phosphate pyrophosphokinase-like domain-containing protein [Euryarchaeota archaeon]